MRIQVRHCLLQGMAGAELFRLQRPSDIVALNCLRQRIAAVAVDHAQLGGLKRPRRIQYMLKQGLARERVQHLGQIGMHARALTGGQDHNVEWGSHKNSGAQTDEVPRL